jgi:hypothetical protein
MHIIYRTSFLVVAIMFVMPVFAQKKTVSQIKLDIETSGNSPLYVKDVLKKKFKIDTVSILRTSGFRSLFDSLGYHGKIGKVYGPYARAPY